MIDMTVVLKDEYGNPMKDIFTRDGEDLSSCKELTLGDACAHALHSVSPEEREVTWEQKWSWSTLAERVRKDSKASLNAAEIRLITRRLGKLYGGLILMQAIPLLDPNAKPPLVE